MVTISSLKYTAQPILNHIFLVDILADIFCNDSSNVVLHLCRRYVTEAGYFKVYHLHGINTLKQ